MNIEVMHTRVCNARCFLREMLFLRNVLRKVILRIEIDPSWLEIKNEDWFFWFFIYGTISKNHGTFRYPWRYL